MTWFKVDDSFHAHPKVLAVDAGALGLWVIAGSWCSANLTDGFVPNHVLPRILPDSAGHAETLVAAGLWARERTGYRFHDWHDFQPTAEEVNEERRAARDRMRALRAKRRANQESAGQPANGSGEQVANVRENFGEVPNPDPTRSKEPSSVGLFDEPPKPKTPIPGSDDDPNWVRFWSVYPKNASKKNARLRWASAIKRKCDPEEIILGAQRYAEKVKRDRTEYRFVKNADGWLNGEMWKDELPPPSPYPPMNPPYRGQSQLPESNAPKRYTPEERCTTHPSYPAKTCGPCRADRLAETAAAGRS